MAATGRPDGRDTAVRVAAGVPSALAANALLFCCLVILEPDLNLFKLSFLSLQELHQSRHLSNRLSCAMVYEAAVASAARRHEHQHPLGFQEDLPNSLQHLREEMILRRAPLMMIVAKLLWRKRKRKKMTSLSKGILLTAEATSMVELDGSICAEGELVQSGA
uniref:Uncharacterized protein n=1 Tax=Oryza punctata TaxID=4537 RepID=A0A0E0LRU9_ORYPU